MMLKLLLTTLSLILILIKSSEAKIGAFARGSTYIDGSSTDFYEHPTNISMSFFVFTDGSTDKGGFHFSDSLVTNKKLTTFYSYETTRQKNVAIFYDFSLNSQKVDLLVSLGRGDLMFYALLINSTTRTIQEDVTASKIMGPLAIESICKYVSPISGLYFIFTLSGDGLIQQWQIYEVSGKVSFGLIRSWRSEVIKPRGCVTDPSSQSLFVVDEASNGVGLMKYKAEYNLDTNGTKVQSNLTNLQGRLKTVALYRSDPVNEGYLIVFNKDTEMNVVLDRKEPHIFLGEEEGKNDISDSTGMTAIEVNLSGSYDKGLVVFFGEDDDGEAYMTFSFKQLISNFTQNYPQNFTSQRYDVCQLGYGCSTINCPSLNNCNSHGLCTNTTNCKCYGGWTGEGCSTFTCSDFQNCNNNGKCVGPNQCECNSGFTGESCKFYVVYPQLETDDSGTDADDPAIWVHPTNPELSCLIGTTKSSNDAGLRVYDMNGKMTQYLPTYQNGSYPNSVDILYSFQFNGNFIDLVYAGLRGNNKLGFWKMNRETRQIEVLPLATFPIDLEVYGSCHYRSPKTGDFYAIVNSKNGMFRQYKIFENQGNLNISLSREWSNGDGTQPEGCVADNELGWLYTGEEAIGVWKYGAEPDWVGQPVQIGSTDISKGGVLQRDIEGMSILYGQNGSGYLVVSTQGINGYAVFNRSDDKYLFSFQIQDNLNKGIDGVTQTDGLDITSCNLGPGFRYGALVVHDDINNFPNGTSASFASFKFVPWESISILKDWSGLLEINPTYNPRLEVISLPTTTTPSATNTIPTATPTNLPTNIPTQTPTNTNTSNATNKSIIFLFSTFLPIILVLLF